MDERVRKYITRQSVKKYSTLIVDLIQHCDGVPKEIQNLIQTVSANEQTLSFLTECISKVEWNQTPISPTTKLGGHLCLLLGLHIFKKQPTPKPPVGIIARWKWNTYYFFATKIYPSWWNFKFAMHERYLRFSRPF